MKDPEQTIIIKKIKKISGGHHGGAWKVAYADFVTAMMAFFLLLWLLSSAPQETLKGIADYFAPTIGIRDQKGIGFEGGLAPRSQGNNQMQKNSGSFLFGSPTAGSVVKAPTQAQDDEDETHFITAEQALKNEIAKDKTLQEFANQILIEQTPEGLQIQITDAANRPMFDPGTANLRPYTKVILTKIIDLIKYMPNFLSISGFTTGVASNMNKFDAWQLSVDRANATRDFLEKSGIDAEQIGRIVGKADRELINHDDPKAPENIRIAILLLKDSLSSYKKRFLSAPQNIK